MLGVFISALAIYLIFRQIDLPALGRAFAEARYIYVIPAVLVLVVGQVTRALRWQVLLSGSLSLQRAFSIINVSYLVNAILPLRMGEVARVYLATRADPPVPVLKSTSTIIVERLLDLLSVVVLLGLVLAVGPLPDELRRVAMFMLPLVAIGFLTLVFLSRYRSLAHRILSAVTNRLPSAIAERPLAEWLDHFLDGLMPLTQPRALFLALFWTGVSWGFSIVAGYIVMLAFFEQASWVATCLYIAAASLAIAVPAVPGSLGPFELSVVLALSATGYADQPDRVAAFALVVHGVNLAMFAIVGIIGFIQEGISLGQLSTGVQEMRQGRVVTKDVVATEPE